MLQANFFLQSRTCASLMQLALKNGKYDFVLLAFHEAKRAHTKAQAYRSGKNATDERKALFLDRIYPLAAKALAEMGKYDEMIELLKENVTQK